MPIMCTNKHIVPPYLGQSALISATKRFVHADVIRMMKIVFQNVQRFE